MRISAALGSIRLRNVRISSLVPCLNVALLLDATREAMGSSAYSHFPRIPSEELSGQGRWPKQDPTGLDQAIIRFYAACTSQKISVEASIALTTELGLHAKRRKLKDSAVPSLFPKAADVRAGSMEWATESIHYPTLQATDGSGTCVSQHRSVTIKICGEDVPN